MRNYREPTAKNLLRDPLVLGVPLAGLIAISLAVLILEIVFSGWVYGNVLLIVFTTVAYVALRIVTRFAKTGWIETGIFLIERKLGKADLNPRSPINPPIRWQTCELLPPDTLDEVGLIQSKESALDEIRRLRPGERLAFRLRMDEIGGSLNSTRQERFDEFGAKYVYSLHTLPVTTDPMWLFAINCRLPSCHGVTLVVKGIDPHKIKTRIETARKRNFQVSGLRNVDSDVSFEEANQILEGISRGSEDLCEISLIITAFEPLDLDPKYFCLEKNHELELAAICGARKRFHRGHIVRAITASDLVPNLGDPTDGHRPLLRTPRGNALYFNPQDERLEALHWLVVGASGSGKSFFTGLVIRRMIQNLVPMSVLFIDHNRSFRRMIRGHGGGVYAEPQNLADVSRSTGLLFKTIDEPGGLVGIELSDLSANEKKPAIHQLLNEIESYLRGRSTVHPIYIVLDECWNFMRDEPVLVQRAFREFRKLNGAAIAITQSLSDFLTDESGRSIFQNAPIRILLRQGEDPAPYRGVLNLNDVELARLRLLRQVKGEFSECLIKTPYLSRLGRLYPTPEEHELLRTDNIRSELIAECAAELKKRYPLKRKSEEMLCFVH